MKQQLDNRIDERRWQILQQRTTEFDGAFYTGVVTTGIFCKPSCPARRPKRENVVFFDSLAAAQQSGLRACLRCKPNEIKVSNPHVQMISQILQSRDADFLTEIEPTPQLQRIFKSIVGVSIKEFAAARRFENFKQNARQTDVTTALYDSGFGSSRGLYEKAAKNLGMTPATYRKGGEKMIISFTITDSFLDKMLVAATGKGVCKISFGDDEQILIDDLRQEFPAATIARDGANLQSHVAAILQNIDGISVELPLDVQATAFQLRVWAELRKIPRGETRTYKQIAAQIEQPNAVRAVARACATNPVAVVTPCHRVIGSNGKLTGYRWGVERKQAILEQEKKS